MNASKPLSLKARTELRRSLWLRLDTAAKRDSALAPLRDQMWKLFQAGEEEQQQQALLQAERQDKGQVLWEVFFPRTKTPLNCSIFDAHRVYTRTPRRILKQGEYFPSKSTWCLADGDPWADLDKALHSEPFDLVAFQQYARDIDELYRRAYRRRNWLVKDQHGEEWPVSAETAEEAARRVRERLGATVVSTEEVW